MGLDTDKHWIRELVSICYLKGITKIVMSPGSRCAPLVIAFSRHTGIECISIVDERCAAFFALGMAQQMQAPVALLCTSGTAVLNYAPAIAEAYYQQLPLVVITADRPPELIDQADGQTIRQNDIYHNYIKQSFQLPVEVTNDEELQVSNGIVIDAIDVSKQGAMGPVHINVPLREPLYGLKEYEEVDRSEVLDNNSVTKAAPDLRRLQDMWASSAKKMLVIGGLPYDEDYQSTINQLSENTSLVTIAEITSNIQGLKIFSCPDALLAAAHADEYEALRPDLLITFGGSLVSKKLKVFLRCHPPRHHWHISPDGAAIDTFQCLTEAVAMEPIAFLEQVVTGQEKVSNDFQKAWHQLLDNTRKRHQILLQKAGYTDLMVFDLLLSTLPKGSNLHLGNSTPIRYTSLFEPNETVTYNCNRGTSGIDGVMSTAAGAAKATGKLTTVITGDVAFFYDSNALWNKHLPENLRVIVINNGGGNIFRVLKGSGELPELEDYFETKMDLRVEHVAKTFNLPYFYCEDLETLKDVLPAFYASNGTCAILEIRTSGVESAAMMRKYLNID